PSAASPRPRRSFQAVRPVRGVGQPSPFAVGVVIIADTASVALGRAAVSLLERNGVPLSGMHFLHRVYPERECEPIDLYPLNRTIRAATGHERITVAKREDSRDRETD